MAVEIVSEGLICLWQFIVESGLCCLANSFENSFAFLDYFNFRFFFLFLFLLFLFLFLFFFLMFLFLFLFFLCDFCFILFFLLILKENWLLSFRIFLTDDWKLWCLFFLNLWVFIIFFILKIIRFFLEVSFWIFTELESLLIFLSFFFFVLCRLFKGFFISTKEFTIFSKETFALLLIVIVFEIVFREKPADLQGFHARYHRYCPHYHLMTIKYNLSSIYFWFNYNKIYEKHEWKKYIFLWSFFMNF